MRGVLFLLGTLAALAIAASLSLMTAGSFQQKWQYHTERWEQATEYMKQPHCRKRSAARTKLKGFHNCDESERILASYPVWFAVLDVSHSVPPLLKSLLDNIREDMLRIALTGGVLGVMWKAMRHYTTPTNAGKGMYPYQGLPVWTPNRPFRVLEDY